MIDDKFRNWLKNETNQPLIITGKDVDYVIYVKIPRDGQFDYLYCHSLSGNKGLERKNDLLYLGMYNKMDDTVYDYQNLFNVIRPTNVCEDSIIDMTNKVEKAVREQIEKWVDNNSRNLTVKELSPILQNNLNCYKENYLQRDIRKAFLSGETGDEVKYASKYIIDGWTDEKLIAFIKDKDKFIKQQSESYYAKNQENILLQLEKNELLSKGLKALESEEDSRLHRIRKILQVMNETDAKTVNITIYKDGQEFTFKTEAGELRRDPQGSYSTWRMTAKDRREFVELFDGHISDYKPEEITEITYCGKTIYAAEPMEEQTVNQGIKLT